VNGFLVIDKSPAMSSYDVIRLLKKLHKFKKIGYIGTLDRNATGVLPVALDEGVKLIPYLEDVQKTYCARVLLGVTTDTLDIEGKVLSETHTEPFQREVIEDILGSFHGLIEQQIPIFSSKKVNRKPLYKYAREGVEVGPHTKKVEIFRLTVTDYSHPYVDLEVVCSKGTYIRALASDLGVQLGCGATLHSLKRTRHGEFSEEMGVAIDAFKIEQDLLNYLLPLEKVLNTVREFTLETVLERFLRHGMPIPLLGNSKDWNDGDPVKIVNKKGCLIGIGVADTATKTIKVKRLIYN
jgi:tRNA pseudouridine55 synthase